MSKPDVRRGLLQRLLVLPTAGYPRHRWFVWHTYRGEGMALIAIAVSFVTVAPMVVGLSKRPNGAEMAVFRTVGTMALS